VEGSKKSIANLEEEVVRTRTRFSVFELWYQNLIQAKSIGTFSDWGPHALADVTSGDTIEFKAELELSPLQALFRLFSWFSRQAQTQGSPFSQKGEELKATKTSERIMQAILGDSLTEIVAVASPVGEAGPSIGMALSDEWMIGRIGRLAGEYTIIAQVDQILNEDQELPTLRLTNDSPPTPLELNILREIVEGFIEPAREMGVEVTTAEAAITGPALWVTPIAIYR
jgi:hypothetical protein